jgi:hypothetical protein
MSWVNKRIGKGKILAAPQVETAITTVYDTTFNGSLYHVVEIKVFNVTINSGITAMLQSATNENGPWKNAKSVPILGDGVFYITLLATKESDQQYLPLLPKARVVMTTGAGDTVSVSEVTIVQQR